MLVGMTGFEPATPRPPGVYATRLRHIPMALMFPLRDCKYKLFLQLTNTILKNVSFFPKTTFPHLVWCRESLYLKKNYGRNDPRSELYRLFTPGNCCRCCGLLFF